MWASLRLQRRGANTEMKKEILETLARAGQVTELAQTLSRMIPD